MFWKTERIYDLAIGRVSEITIKKNEKMVKGAYYELLEKKKNKLRSLFKDFMIVSNIPLKKLSKKCMKSFEIKEKYLFGGDTKFSLCETPLSSIEDLVRALQVINRIKKEKEELYPDWEYSTSPC